jgi:hypothetical protein
MELVAAAVDLKGEDGALEARGLGRAMSTRSLS